MTAGISTGTATHDNEVMANVGFGWKLGKENREDLGLPERYDGKQMASIYMMQSEMDRVLYENQKDKEKAKEQEAKIEEQNQEINSQKSAIRNQKAVINNQKKEMLADRKSVV